jgi:hypothetical protein
MLLVPTVVFAGTSGPSPIPPPPAFQLSTPVLTLCRGVENNIPILVTNPGAQPMTSLQVGLVASRNIYAIGNGTVNQATVPANGSITSYLPIFVSLNTSNLVSAGITVNYNYYSLYSDSEIRNVSFGVETCTSPLSVQTNPVITSGEVRNITLNLKNTGNTTLSSISFQMSIPSSDAAILTNQPIHVGTLLPGQATQVNEKTFVFSSAAQTFPLNVSIQLYEGTKPVQILDTFPTLSVGTINITASSITLSPASPTAGSIFSVSMILTDTGTAGASAVTVSPLPPTGITVYGSNSVFVGDMSADSQVPVTMTLLANASVARGAHTIPVKISYLNSLRENINTTIYVPVTLSSGLTSNFTSGGVGVGNSTRYAVARRGGVSTVTIAVVVVILALLAAVAYVKRKTLGKLVARLRKKKQQQAK